MMAASFVSGGIMLLIYLVGVIVALVNWRRWPQVCAMVFAACAILLVCGLFQMVLTPLIISRSTGGASAVAAQLGLLNMVFALVRAVASGLLIWAPFVGRPLPVEQFTGFDQLPPRAQ
jgi:hypothetical protein